MNKFIFIFLLFISSISGATSCRENGKNTSQSTITHDSENPASSEIQQTAAATKIKTGAEQMEKYLPLLINKRVGLVVNHTSVVLNSHLVDTLLAMNVKITKIFAPEHGFRGQAPAGEKVANEVDAKTGIPIISLYGNNKKPTAAQLKDLDVLLFDIQDVGVRFYTYISTMHYLMEACAANNKPLIILDRPNPNGFYIDGPILQPKYKSFIGMHPIPVVHGLTVGELALMINGEKWLDSSRVCDITIIKNENYTHKDTYSLPVNPSPNLPNDRSIQLYPTLGLFEGTMMSMGRGTEFPFQVVGAPDKVFGTFTFTPRTIPGKAKNPPHENQLCYGIDYRSNNEASRFTLQPIIHFYKIAPDKEKYFISFFHKLVGNDIVMKQIKEGMSEAQIKATWEKELSAYKAMRKKYLLYTDFE